MTTTHACLSNFSFNYTNSTDFLVCAVNTDLKLIPIFFALFIAMLSLAVAFRAVLVNRYMAQVKNTIDFEAKIEGSKQYNAMYRKYLDFKATNTAFNWERVVKDNKNIKYKTIMAIVNPWESAANGIDKGVYKDYLLYNMYGSELIGIYDYSQEFINNFRSINENPRVFEQAEALYIKWKARHNLVKIFRPNKYKNNAISKSSCFELLTAVPWMFYDSFKKYLFRPFVIVSKLLLLIIFLIIVIA